MSEHAPPVGSQERVAEALHRGWHNLDFGKKCSEDEPRRCLHYREACREADALLAAGVFRVAPTAEQIAMRLSLVRFSDEESDRLIELTMREAWPLADAVMDLMGSDAK